MDARGLRFAAGCHTRTTPRGPARYEKYDAPMNKRRGTKGDDPFEEEYELLEATIDDLNKVTRFGVSQHDFFQGPHPLLAAAHP